MRVVGVLNRDQVCGLFLITEICGITTVQAVRLASFSSHVEYVNSRTGVRLVDRICIKARIIRTTGPL